MAADVCFLMVDAKNTRYADNGFHVEQLTSGIYAMKVAVYHGPSLLDPDTSTGGQLKQELQNIHDEGRRHAPRGGLLDRYNQGMKRRYDRVNAHDHVYETHELVLDLTKQGDLADIVTDHGPVTYRQGINRADYTFDNFDNRMDYLYRDEADSHRTARQFVQVARQNTQINKSFSGMMAKRAQAGADARDDNGNFMAWLSTNVANASTVHHARTHNVALLGTDRTGQYHVQDGNQIQLYTSSAAPLRKPEALVNQLKMSVSLANLQPPGNKETQKVATLLNELKQNVATVQNSALTNRERASNNDYRRNAGLHLGT